MINYKDINYKEVDIEDFVWNRLSGNDLNQRGIKMYGHTFFRQFNIPGSGIIDIMGVEISRSQATTEKSVNVYIYELKRGCVTCADVGQTVRYVHSIDQNSPEILAELNIPEGYTLRISSFLIGPAIERDAACIMQYLKGMEYIEFGFDWQDGVVFKHNNTSYNIEINIDAVKERIGNLTLYKMARRVRKYGFQ